MAKADYIVSLIKSHYDSEPERFTTLALQIAAYEAKMGHSNVANEIKTFVDKAKENKYKTKTFAGDFNGLLTESPAFDNLRDIIE